MSAITKQKLIAIITAVVSLSLVTLGFWQYMGPGALIIPGGLLWIDLTIWSIKK